MHGYRVVGGIGILVQRGGASYRSRYARPVMLRLSSRAIRASSLVVRWRRGHMSVVRAAVTGRGSARIPVAGNASYAVLTPPAAGPAAGQHHGRPARGPGGRAVADGVARGRRTAKKFTVGSDGRSAALSPDGNTLYVWKGTGQQSNVAVVDTGTESVRRVLPC